MTTYQIDVEQAHEALVVYRADKQPRFVPACMCGWRSADALDSAVEANAWARLHVDLSVALAGRRS